MKNILKTIILISTMMLLFSCNNEFFIEGISVAGQTTDASVSSLSNQANIGGMIYPISSAYLFDWTNTRTTNCPNILRKYLSVSCGKNSAGNNLYIYVDLFTTTVFNKTVGTVTATSCNTEMYLYEVSPATNKTIKIYDSVGEGTFNFKADQSFTISKAKLANRTNSAEILIVSLSGSYL